MRVLRPLYSRSLAHYIRLYARISTSTRIGLHAVRIHAFFVPFACLTRCSKRQRGLSVGVVEASSVAFNCKLAFQRDSDPHDAAARTGAVEVFQTMRSIVLSRDELQAQRSAAEHTKIVRGAQKEEEEEDAARTAAQDERRRRRGSRAERGAQVQARRVARWKETASSDGGERQI